MQAINWQYQAMEEKHWAHEDLEYQKKICGNVFVRRLQRSY